jgi:hypothetical protein
MFISKFFFIILILGLFSRSYSQETTLVELRGCVSNSVCEDKEIAAEQHARNMAVYNFEIESVIAASQQTDTCRSRIKDNFEKNCNSQLYRNLKIKIEAVKESINQKNAQVKQTQKSITGAASESQESIEQIINRLKVLITDINNLKALELTPLETALKKLNKTCELEYDLVNQVCQAPFVSSEGNETVIKKRKIVGTSSSVDKSIVPEGTAQVSTVTAVAKVKVSGAIDAPEVEAARQVAESGYTNTSRVGGSTNATFEDTSDLAVASLNQAKEIILSLRGISVQSSGPECDEFGDGCDNPVSPNADPLGKDLPYSMGVPVNEPGDGAAAKTTATGGNNGGGVSGDQVMADAQSGAYGAPGGTGDSSQGGGSGAGTGGSAQGGVGGAMSGLSGLSSMFGKTGGSSFGNDSSYASSSSGRRYNNSGGSAGNYAIPTDTTYNPNNYTNNDNNSPNMPNQRAFQGGNGNNANNGYGSAANNGNGSPLGSSNNNKGTNNNPKPNFFSRLFGKKDKTFLGKNINGNGGGYGSAARSGKSGSGSYDSRIDKNNALQKTDAKSFDPSKYAPSKAAQDRAYARATGRKIASHSSDRGYLTEWPSDISKNKKTSMFVKVGLAHKIQKLDK